MKKEDNGKKYYTVSKISYTIRVGVALYLFYTVWQLREAPFNSEGAERVVFIAAIVLFLVCGAVIGFTSLRALIKKEYSENNPSEDDLHTKEELISSENEPLSIEEKPSDTEGQSEKED